jgi:excisionase family DNA binding protein
MLTVAEAAAELGVSVRAVQNRIRAGEMDAEKVTPRLYLISRSEVERWKPVGKRKGGRPRTPKPHDPEQTEERGLTSRRRGAS